jgi:protein PhnA
LIIFGFCCRSLPLDLVHFFNEVALTYADQLNYACSECGYEWLMHDTKNVDHEVVVDANKVALNNGDSVTLIKDLKVKGTSSTVKVGTKIKNIRLTSGDHNIDCKIPGIGKMQLKSEFVKKA